MFPSVFCSLLLILPASQPLLAQRNPYHRTLDGNIYRSWTEWTSWSVCSRTCGGGVRTRTRTCRLKFVDYKNHHSETCLGDTIEYDLCHKQNCPSHSEEFLLYQCARYKHHVISGRKIDEWIPYMNAKTPCQLQCLSGDRNLSYRFGKVIDGTKCILDREANLNGICVNGRCTNIDCAGQLGFDNQMDKCGVCRGDNSSCIHYRNSYWSRPRPNQRNSSKSDHHYDYNLIVEIPVGATQISVREYSVNNFLAAIERNGKLLLNGNWKISSPGRFQNDEGMEFIYTRNSAGQESLFAVGPITKAIQILVLGKADLPTVNYEYWASRNESGHNTVMRHHKSFYHLEHTKSDISMGADQSYHEYHEDFNPKIRGFNSYYDQNKILTHSHHKFSHKYKNLSDGKRNRTSSYNWQLEESNSNQRIPATQSSQNWKRQNLNLKEFNPHQGRNSDLYKVQPPSRENNSSYDSEVKNSILALLDQRPTKFVKLKKSRRSRKRHADRDELSSEAHGIQVDKPKQKKGKRKRKRGQDIDDCPACSRVKNPKLHFCSSDFVLRAIIRESEVHQQEMRFEVQVIQSFKNKVPILSKEYIWSPDTCKCPRLRVGNEYILMGRLTVSKKSRESKLLVDKTSFVRRYSPKRARTVQKLVRNQVSTCKR